MKEKMEKDMRNENISLISNDIEEKSTLPETIPIK
jgi:hypothetical protein